MNPATIIAQASADGVKLALSATGSVKATGDGAAVNRWLPIIREHKAEIIKLLKVGDSNQSTISRRWLFHFTDRNDLPVTFVPAVDHATALDYYPTAVAAEPVGRTASRTATAAEVDELRLLIETVFPDDSEADRTEALEIAILDVDDALVCYRDLSLKRVT